MSKTTFINRTTAQAVLELWGEYGSEGMTIDGLEKSMATSGSLLLKTGAKLGINSESKWYVSGYAQDGNDVDRILGNFNRVNTPPGYDKIFFGKPVYAPLLLGCELGPRQEKIARKEYDHLDEETFMFGTYFFFAHGNCDTLGNYMRYTGNSELSGWDGVHGTSAWGGDVVKMYDNSSGERMVKFASFYRGKEG